MPAKENILALQEWKLKNLFAELLELEQLCLLSVVLEQDTSLRKLSSKGGIPKKTPSINNQLFLKYVQISVAGKREVISRKMSITQKLQKGKIAAHQSVHSSWTFDLVGKNPQS